MIVRSEPVLIFLLQLNIYDSIIDRDDNNDYPSRKVGVSVLEGQIHRECGKILSWRMASDHFSAMAIGHTRAARCSAHSAEQSGFFHCWPTD